MTGEGLAIGALLLSAEIVEPNAPQYLDRLQQMFQNAMAWAKQPGLPVEQLSRAIALLFGDTDDPELKKKLK